MDKKEIMEAGNGVEMEQNPEVKQVGKPLVLVKEEFVDDIWAVIRKYGLPAFIMLPVFADLAAGARENSQREYEVAKLQYEAAVKEAGGAEKPTDGAN